LSEQETLRLIAEVVDKYSGPLKSMQASLKSLSDTSKGIHGQGVVQANQHAKAYKELGEQIRKVKDTALDVVKPAFSALGLEALTIAGSIASVGRAVKEFGEAGRSLEFTRRSSGLTAGTIRALSEADEQLGISAEETNVHLKTFGEHMDALQRRAPAALQAYNDLPGLWQKLGRSLQGLPREAQLDKIMKFIPTVKYEDQRRKVLAFYGLPEDWASLTDREITALRAKGDEFNKRFPFNAENAAKAKATFDELSSTFRGLKTSLEGEFAPGVTSALKNLNDVLADKELLAQFSESIKAIDGVFGQWGSHLGGIKTDMKDLADIINGIKWVFDLDKKVTSALTGDKPNPFASTLHGALPETDGKTASTIGEAIKDGFLKLQEYLGTKGLVDYAGQYGAGMRPIAYTESVGGRRGASFGSAQYPGISDETAKSIEQTSKSLGRAQGGAEGTSGEATSNGTLAERRARFAKELENPAIRDQVKGMMHTEGTPSRSLEALMNRQEYTGGSLLKGLHSGFYGPINRGQLPGAIATIQRNAKLNAKYEAAIGKVLGGSNDIKGYTDQGMPTDPNGSRRSAATARDHISLGGNEFTDWAGGPGGRGAAHRFRLQQQQAIAEAAAHHGAKLADHIRHGRSQRDNSLLTNGKRSEAGEMRGSLDVTIDHKNAARGVTVSQRNSGDIFKSVKLNRGSPLSQASQDS